MAVSPLIASYLPTQPTYEKIPSTLVSDILALISRVQIQTSDVVAEMNRMSSYKTSAIREETPVHYATLIVAVLSTFNDHLHHLRTSTTSNPGTRDSPPNQTFTHLSNATKGAILRYISACLRRSANIIIDEAIAQETDKNAEVFWREIVEGIMGQLGAAPGEVFGLDGEEGNGEVKAPKVNKVVVGFLTTELRGLVGERSGEVWRERGLNMHKEQ